jgi:hypothetical protein
MPTDLHSPPIESGDVVLIERRHGRWVAVCEHPEEPGVWLVGPPYGVFGKRTLWIHERLMTRAPDHGPGPHES